MTARLKLRVAVAEQTPDSGLAPHLGRAVKFALFDVHGDEVRGPLYRVRLDTPGETCGDHEELFSLLHDCQVVIVGAAGLRMEQRLKERGIEVATTCGGLSSEGLVARYLAGSLPQASASCRVLAASGSSSATPRHEP